jgi:hypothetical protein
MTFIELVIAHSGESAFINTASIDYVGHTTARDVDNGVVETMPTTLIVAGRYLGVLEAPEDIIGMMGAESPTLEAYLELADEISRI